MEDTVVDCLRRTAERSPENGVTVYDARGDKAEEKYPELLRRAQRFAFGLRRRGLAAGQRIGLYLPSSVEFFVAYFGALMARLVPVSLPVPAFGRGLSRREAQRFAAIVEDARLACLIDGAGLDGKRIVPEEQPRCTFAAVAELGEGAGGELQRERLDDPALIQYTSGSTSSPRGVVLSEQNISVNVQLIAHLVDMNPRDTIDLWIPLFHDMGLMGSLATIASGANLRVCSPSVFLMDPLGWLLRFAARGATINPSPNFFYRLLVDEYDPERARDLDLRRWRVAFNGAEMVRPADVERFQQVYGPHGFPATTMFPVYGLAEATLALTFPPLGASRVVQGAEVFGPDCAPRFRQRPFMSVGVPLPGHEITLRRPPETEQCWELPPQVGEILARGPCIMQGYTDSAGSSPSQPFVDGWLRTRDLGFVHDGHLYICGRMDEVIIVRGANYFPEDIEAFVEQSGLFEGAEITAKAAFRLDGISPDGVGLAIEVKRAPDGVEERARRLEGELLRQLGFRVRVIVLGQRAVPRTTSGKLKRLALAAMLAQGELSEKIVAAAGAIELPGSPAG
ncbi:AMP-binding protein [Sorangium sp. So ce327]|uniref:AMP-binding protein n=1 Tax=Sorangium sp. So ce327 TaxID=3133301 RepID=UPI003F6307FB